MRVKASAVGLNAEEYRAELAAESGWTGMAELEVGSDQIDSLYEHGFLDLRGGAGPALPHRGGADRRAARPRWPG